MNTENINLEFLKMKYFCSDYLKMYKQDTFPNIVPFGVCSKFQLYLEQSPCY